jgi:amidase
MKRRFLLGILVALVCVVIGVRRIGRTGVAAQSRAAFEVEEATIAGIHAAITSSQTTCQAVVHAYIDRAKAYNGVCTMLLTPAGANIAPTSGYVRAGAPLES